ncbi:hypothetical protein MASR1M46_10690 [Bacteroidales bacterium]
MQNTRKRGKGCFGKGNYWLSWEATATWTSPLGINLPNADWIRKEHGSKSVTIANISEAYDKAAEEAPKSMTAEFSWDEAESALIKQHGSVTNNLHTDMHECLGHASGQPAPEQLQVR